MHVKHSLGSEMPQTIRNLYHWTDSQTPCLVLRQPSSATFILGWLGSLLGFLGNLGFCGNFTFSKLCGLWKSWWLALILFTLGIGWNFWWKRRFRLWGNRQRGHFFWHGVLEVSRCSLRSCCWSYQVRSNTWYKYFPTDIKSWTRPQYKHMQWKNSACNAVSWNWRW